MKIAVIGTGYVGLVTGTCFAESGHDVTCVDHDPRKIELLLAGGVPIYEPGLEELVRRNVGEGRLRFTTRYQEAVPGVDAAFIAVGTPPGETGEADLSYVLSAAESIGRALTGYCVVVNKSTVPVGSSDQVKARAEAAGLSRALYGASLLTAFFFPEVADAAAAVRPALGAVERAAVEQVADGARDPARLRHLRGAEAAARLVVAPG